MLIWLGRAATSAWCIAYQNIYREQNTMMQGIWHDMLVCFPHLKIKVNQVTISKEAYMNLVPIRVWSFSKLTMKCLGLFTTSPYVAIGGGYSPWLKAVSFMGNGLLLKQDVDAIHNLIYWAFSIFPAPPLTRKGKTNKKEK